MPERRPRQGAETVALAAAETMWASDLASQHLGIQLDEVTPGYARARMRVASTIVNDHDICHGGFVFGVADTAFSRRDG